MENSINYSESLKSPEEAASYLNSSIKDGNLEYFLYTISKIAKVNGEILKNDKVLLKNEEFAELEEIGPEIVKVFNLLHALGLRLVPQYKIETEPIDVDLPENCYLNRDSIRKNRFDVLHSKDEIDFIIRKLEQIQYPDDEFIEYAVKFYYYRNEFYKRGTVKNFLFTSTYEHSAVTENAVSFHHNEIAPVIYRIVINYYQSLDESLKHVNQFCKELEQEVREVYKLDDEVVKRASEFDISVMYIRNYPLDAKGRKMGNAIFDKWSECLRIYDACQELGDVKKKDICITVGKFNLTDTPNSYKHIREHRAEAERLIKSAENGTFPY